MSVAAGSGDNLERSKSKSSDPNDATDKERDSVAELDDHELDDYADDDDIIPGGGDDDELEPDKKSDSDDDEDDVTPDKVRSERAISGDAGAKSPEAEVDKRKLLQNVKICPDLEDKFRPGVVQALIEKVIREHLEGLTYDATEMPTLVKSLSEAIQHKVKQQKYDRYKLITCVALGERRGEGISAATRCVWDAQSDCIATYTFISETFFCCATVYGIYFY